jgi:hypothetical protein
VQAVVVLTILAANGWVVQQYSMMKLRKRKEKVCVLVRASITTLAADCKCCMLPS